MTDLQKNAEPNPAAPLTGEPITKQPNVVEDATAMAAHVDVAKSDFADLEKGVKDSPAAEHDGIRGLLERLRSRLEDLGKHANYNVTQAEKAAAADPAVTAPVVPRSKATSDAHLNTGNGGPVTGNPGASYTQASAAQAAVDQGAKIPGVATVPQPDVAVR
jgi:hypothetical protein